MAPGSDSDWTSKGRRFKWLGLMLLVVAIIAFVLVWVCVRRPGRKVTRGSFPGLEESLELLSKQDDPCLAMCEVYRTPNIFRRRVERRLLSTVLPAGLPIDKLNLTQRSVIDDVTYEPLLYYFVVCLRGLPVILEDSERNCQREDWTIAEVSVGTQLSRGPRPSSDDSVQPSFLEMLWLSDSDTGAAYGTDFQILTPEIRKRAMKFFQILKTRYIQAFSCSMDINKCESFLSG